MKGRLRGPGFSTLEFSNFARVWFDVVPTGQLPHMLSSVRYTETQKTIMSCLLRPAIYAKLCPLSMIRSQQVAKKSSHDRSIMAA